MDFRVKALNVCQSLNGTDSESCGVAASDGKGHSSRSCATRDGGIKIILKTLKQHGALYRTRGRNRISHGDEASGESFILSSQSNR